MGTETRETVRRDLMGTGTRETVRRDLMETGTRGTVPDTRARAVRARGTAPGTQARDAMTEKTAITEADLTTAAADREQTGTRNPRQSI